MKNRMSMMRRIGKYLWRTTVALLAVGIFLFAVILLCAYMEHLNTYKVTKSISENVEVRYFPYKKSLTVYNKATDEYTIEDLQWVSDDYTEDSLSVFCKNGKRGFYDIFTGEEVIRAHYNRAWIFSEGVAAVVLDGKIGFINEKDEMILPFKYDYADRNGWPVDYLFLDDYCVMTNERGACGLIDKKGEWAVKPLYDCIWTPHYHKYRIVKDGDKYGLLDENLEFKLPVEYDFINFSNSERALLLTVNGCQRMEDFDGNIIKPFVYDYYTPLKYQRKMTYYPLKDEEGNGIMLDTVEEVLSDYVEYGLNGLSGVFNKKTGKVIIPALYNRIYMVSETLFEATIEEYNSRILIDNHGRMVDPKN